LAAMIVSAQTVDRVLVDVVGWSGGLNYGTFPPQFVEADTSAETHTHGGMWDGSTTVLSVGLLASMAICVPFGVLKLEDNIGFQWVSFACLVMLVIALGVQFTLFSPGGMELSRAPLVGVDAHHLVGVIAFSYTFVVTIPSWVNEKQPGVSVSKVMWQGCGVAALMLVVVGLTGCWAYDLTNPSLSPQNQVEVQNILLIMTHRNQPVFGRVIAYLFTLTTLIPGIPVLMVIVRYNLVSSGVIPQSWATAIAVWLPWLVTMLMYQKGWFQSFLNWTTILCSGFVNFGIPPVLYYCALGSEPSDDGVGELTGVSEDGVADGSSDVDLHQKAPDSAYMKKEEDPLLAMPTEPTARVDAYDAVPVGMREHVTPKRMAILMGASMMIMIAIAIVLTLVRAESPHEYGFDLDEDGDEDGDLLQLLGGHY